MNVMDPVVSASLSPNVELDDVMRAIGMLFTPWRWKYGTSLSDVVDWFAREYNAPDIRLFSSGRVALYALLTSYGIGPGDEVIVQAFTCVAVVNSILWTGATPVYVDIDDTYNIDPERLAGVITKKTRVVIVQHTFGIPAKLSKIKTICKKSRVALVEDCAHAIGARADGAYVGTTSDAAIFSFGRDKAISSVWGGACYVNRTGLMKRALDRVADIQQSFPMPNSAWIARELFHPIAFAIIIPLYRLQLGKALLVLFQKLGMLSIPVYPVEKHGGKPAQLLVSYPNALAFLLTLQLSKQDRYVARRRAVADTYFHSLSPSFPLVHGASFLRYPIRRKNAADIVAHAKTTGILLGTWYHHVIDPIGVDLTACGYTPGSCPKSEAAAKEIINLPTRINNTDVARVVGLFR